MAELVAAVPELLRPEQAAQHYAEAVQTAVAACAEDTAGQRCYICLDAGRIRTRASCAGARAAGGWIRARVVLGAAGAGRGPAWRPERVEAVAHVSPVRASVPRRRGVRARVGVLEDLRRAAGDGWARRMVR